MNRVLRGAPLVILFMIKTLVFLSLVSPVTAMDWTTETVDSTGDIGLHTSLALDSSRNPRISYLDFTNRHLKYAIKTDGIWTSETVDTLNFTGEFSSLKLDSSSHPLISYYDSNRGNLTCTMKKGDVWSRVIIDSGGVGRYTSIALDSSNIPQISYQDLGSMKLKYARKTGETWTNETVDNSVNVGAYTSLALDTGGNPHISYYDGTKGDLKYARKIGGQWSNQTVDSTGNIGYYTSIALDSAGNPHISYYDGVNRDLKYARKTGSSWTKEIVDATGSVGKFTSLAIDESDNPRISYYDETNGHLKYAAKNGDLWTNETVDTEANVGQYTSLALDDLGNPQISYRDFGNNDLKYAIGIPPLLLDFTASSPYGTAPLMVRFSDASCGGLPSLWNWSFGDGTWFNTSLNALKNPEHVYETPGLYTVNLTVRNLTVATTLSRSGYVTVIAPPETTLPTPSPTPTLTSSPTPTPTSLPTPTPTPNEGSESDDDPLPVPSSTPVQREAGLLSCQTVYVGGDSAISRVTVTGQGISDIIVTARKIVSQPTGVATMDRPVYQYIEVIPSRWGGISAARVEFDVPLLTIADFNGTRDAVSICMMSNSTWACLPTFIQGTKNGRVLYAADTPKFSLFAITIRNDTTLAPHESTTTGLFPSKNDPGHEVQDNFIPANPATPVSLARAGRNSGTPFITFVILAAGIIGIGIGVVLVKYGWTRPRNRKKR